MTAVIKNSFRLHSAKEFIESISEGSPDDNFYLVIAKKSSSPWSGANKALYREDAPTDSVPAGGPTPLDTVSSEYLIWDEFIAAKKIQPSDVSLVVKRIDHWTDVTNGTAISYPQYDSARDDLPNDNFFVLKKDGVNLNVYKVIDNLSTKNVQTLSTDADLITGNVISISIDGITVSQNFINNSNDDTLAAFAVKIANELNVATAVVTDAGTNDRDIVITSSVAGYEPVILNAVVTGGASQAGVTVVTTTAGTVNNANAPTGQSTGITLTADNYRWKYMYSISAGDAEKFLTDSWMPVSTLLADDLSVQWDVQQAAVKGDVENLRIDDGGTQYALAEGISITSSEGTSFAATVAAVDGGAITRVSISNAGSGYRVEDAGDVVISTGLGTGAVLTPMVSPSKGHGADAEEELGSFFVMVNVKLNDDEGGAVPVGDDFRIIGILKNPLLGNGNKVTTTYINPTGAGANSTAIGTLATEVEADTGQFIYSEFRTPLSRTATQTEDLKMIIQF